MLDTDALKVALDLVHVPSQAGYLRTNRLPAGTVDLLKIASGDRDAIGAACEQTGRSSAIIERAAAFFIEQVLLSPDADSYRVLGTDRGASGGELRRNMALLLKFMHPDVAEAQSLFARRVTQAWNDLKSPERRAAYDHAHYPKSEPRGKKPARKHRPPVSGAQRSRSRVRHPKRRSLIGRALALLLRAIRTS